MSKTQQKEFMKALEELRAKTKLTCERFAEFLGITPQTYYNWKSGKGVTQMVVRAVEAYLTLNNADLKWLVNQRID